MEIVKRTRKTIIVSLITLIAVIVAGIMYGTNTTSFAAEGDENVSQSEIIQITQQPENTSVRYPGGTSFEVRVDDPSKVDSYQWYLKISAVKSVALDGKSAKTNKLILPSTTKDWDGNTYFCKIKDLNGGELTSDTATLTLTNPHVNKKVLYIGEAALEPGDSLDLKETDFGYGPMGSGTVNYHENGFDIVLKDVQYDCSDAVYDVASGPSVCFCLDRRYYGEDHAPEKYHVTVEGENRFTNTFFDEAFLSAHETMDFYFLHAHEEFRPTVVFQGTGSLEVVSGNPAINTVAGNFIIDTNIITRRNSENYFGGIKAENITIAENAVLDMEVNGPAMFADNALHVMPGAKIDIEAYAPKVGDLDTKTQVIGATKGTFEGASINIDAKAKPSMFDPKHDHHLAVYSGMEVSAMEMDECDVDIRMSAEKGAEEYAFVYNGIATGGGVPAFVTSSTINISLDSEAVESRFSGIYTDNGIRFRDTDLKINGKINGEAAGIRSRGTVDFSGRTNADISAASYKEGNIVAGILSKACRVDIPKEGSTITARGENGAGLLIYTDKRGTEEKGYDPDYTSGSLKFSPDSYIITPKAAQMSTISFLDADELYSYYECLYDIADTVKPAEKVSFGCVDTLFNIGGASVTGIKKKTYNGKEQKQSLKVTLFGKNLKEGKDYEVYYKNNVNAGTAGFVIAGAGEYKGCKFGGFTVSKAKNPMTVKAKGKTFKAKALKKKSYTYKALDIKKAKGKVTCSKASGNKKITVSKKTGKVTVKKGLKKGTYKVKVKVKAAGNANYKASGAKTVTFKIKVK